MNTSQISNKRYYGYIYAKEDCYETTKSRRSGILEYHYGVKRTAKFICIKHELATLST